MSHESPQLDLSSRVAVLESSESRDRKEFAEFKKWTGDQFTVTNSHITMLGREVTEQLKGFCDNIMSDIKDLEILRAERSNASIQKISDRVDTIEDKTNKIEIISKEDRERLTNLSVDKGILRAKIGILWVGGGMLLTVIIGALAKWLLI